MPDCSALLEFQTLRIVHYVCIDIPLGIVG